MLACGAPEAPRLSHGVTELRERVVSLKAASGPNEGQIEDAYGLREALRYLRGVRRAGDPSVVDIRGEVNRLARPSA